MFIAFTFAESNVPVTPGSEHISGTAWSLSINRTLAGGLYYPQIAEATDPESYCFLAGRVLAPALNSGFPAGHPVTTAAVDGWTFPGPEPDGSWIALKFDRRADLLTAAADIFLGQRWFYTRQANAWYLSNSLRQLCRLLPAKPALEQRAVPYMLRNGYLPHQITPLEDVFQLDAGEVLTLDHDRHSITTRAHLPVHRRPVNPDYADGAGIAETIGDAVSAATAGLSSVTLPLSGGMDSRFLLGSVLRALPREGITTMTFGHPHSWDYRIGTGLARRLGLRSIPLEMDRRPLPDILHENFAGAEGMYCTPPDYPVAEYRNALPESAFVLLGYLGDPVFGSKEKADLLSPAGPLDAEHLAALIDQSMFVPEAEVQPLLADPHRDPLGISARLCNLPGSTLQEKHDFWYFHTHTLNRTHFALFVARHKAFFLTPMIHRRVLDLAFALPSEARQKERAYFAALEREFPELFAFPTTRNFGFPLNTPGSLTTISRALNYAANRLDTVLGPLTGTILYHHPRHNYAHPRELLQSRHRDYLEYCFDMLQTLPALDSVSLRKLRLRVQRRSPVSKSLLQVLLTLHQWLEHYTKTR